MDLGGVVRRGVLAGANGPHGLVGQHHPAQSAGSRPASTAPSWRTITCSVRAPSRSASVSPTQTSGVMPAPSRPGLLGHLLVGLAEQVPPLRVADQHHPRARLLHHRDGDPAGEGALGFPVHVLGADSHVGRDRIASDSAAMETAGGKNQRLRPSTGAVSGRNFSAKARASAGPWFIFQLAAKIRGALISCFIPHPARPRRAAPCPPGTPATHRRRWTRG